jgi:hypothetical protein
VLAIGACRVSHRYAISTKLHPVSPRNAPPTLRHNSLTPWGYTRSNNQMMPNSNYDDTTIESLMAAVLALQLELKQESEQRKHESQQHKQELERQSQQHKQELEQQKQMLSQLQQEVNELKQKNASLTSKLNDVNAELVEHRGILARIQLRDCVKLFKRLVRKVYMMVNQTKVDLNDDEVVAQLEAPETCEEWEKVEQSHPLLRRDVICTAVISSNRYNSLAHANAFHKKKPDPTDKSQHLEWAKLVTPAKVSSTVAIVEAVFNEDEWEQQNDFYSSRPGTPTSTRALSTG